MKCFSSACLALAACLAGACFDPSSGTALSTGGGEDQDDAREDDGDDEDTDELVGVDAIAMTDAGAPDTDSGTAGDTDAGAGDPSCPAACDSPPAPTCVATAILGGSTNCRATSYDEGVCEDGSCTYAPAERWCDFGCNADSTDCEQEADFCAGVPCGTAYGCGGVCLAGSGCCTASGCP